MYDYLYREIFSNRWLVWFLVVSACVAVGLLWYIRHSFIEMENLFPANNLVSIHRENSIRVRVPGAHQILKSPFTALGEARGVWFFEGDFPVKVLDEEGNLIKMAIAKAQGDWMTEDFVPFLVRIDFNVEKTTYGTLVFQKDNPSGLPQNDFEFAVPIVLSAE